VFGMSAVGWRCVVKRSGGKLYKLVMEDVPPYQPTKLWNLSDDPYELTNLANLAVYATVQAELQQEILGWQQAVGDPWPAQPNALAKTSYSSVPTNVQPTTIQLQRQDDGSWMARVPSQSGVTFNLQETITLGPAGWITVGEAKSGNGNMLNFPVSVDYQLTNQFFRVQQSW
jgi:hypothetical protein